MVQRHVKTRAEIGTPVAFPRRMAKPRYVPPNSTVEITDKCINDMLLLRPSPELNDLFLGILGMALVKFGVLLHAFVVMSNHLHMLVTTPDAATLARFMNFVKSKLAREITRLHNWKDKVFASRYNAVIVVDEDAQVERARYIMSHGVKEDLVWDPEHWPGATSMPTLIHGDRLTGTYYDRTAYHRAKRRGNNVALADFATTCDIPITKLPCWAHLDDQEYQKRCCQLLESIREETKARFRRNGVTPMGPRAIRRQSPHSRPRRPKRTPAPLCHASTQRARREFRRKYRAFVSEYKAASARYRAGDLDVLFPQHCFPPPRSFVVPAALPS